MKRLLAAVFACAIIFVCALYGATILGNVRGIVHDPHHLPIQGAQATIFSQTSEWSQTTRSNADGTFQFDAVPVGDYACAVGAPGFASVRQAITVTSGSAPILHFPLTWEGLSVKVEVLTPLESIVSQSPTPETIIRRQEIARAPGADRTNSLAMITDFVPGAYLTHDQLHIRGGHQVTWAVDGVPIPNTNIASNVGPQFDPKDVDYLEIQRGSYAADYGDRTYGVFNMVPRTGFERNNEAEIVTSYGNFNQTNNQISIGSHTERFAYFASLNGNRSDLGLQTPTSDVIHDSENGFGGFGTLLFNLNRNDQFRFVTSLRKDFYQVPNDPEQQIAGVHDSERESDAIAAFSWIHTAAHGLLLTVSPFYHFNRADFIGGRNDPEFSVQQKRSSGYEGAQFTLGAVSKGHNARIGFYGFAQQDNTSIGVQATGGDQASLSQRENLAGHLEAIFFEDEYRVASWLRLSGGTRLTHFSGEISENVASPRLGAAINVPHLHWVLHGFYGRFYQAPPLSTVSGPLLSFVLDQGLGYIPLHGERDEEYQYGLTIPLKGWTFDADNFRTKARNFFDHNAVGNSNAFLPLTIDSARIRGTEATLRSPRLFRRAQIRVAYSHQYAEGFGTINGGLTDFSPPAGGFYLDHDQRHTLNAGFDVDWPRSVWISGNVCYGSGFPNDNSEGPVRLQGHTTLDLTIGKSLGKKLSLSISALNVANRRFLLDNSLTFGGTHFFNPREIFVQAKYRFHY
jgi:hypothetical protein